MDAQLREQVRQRAKLRCEYCHLPTRFAYRPFHIDHIVPEKHGGLTTPGNLALACNSCNLRKGTNLSGIDSATGGIVELFHPRKDRWADQFRYEQGVLLGRTPVGRATIGVLGINEPHLVDLRLSLMDEGVSFD